MSIKCSNCAFENAAGSKFCENCGQPFERACTNCGAPVSSAAKFCRNCGFNLASAPNTPQAKLADLQRATPALLSQKILATRDKIDGERKLVTVLFTDIVGSTALAENLDPEDWGEIISGVHRRVTQAIYKYEGTIAQLLGDGVLAFFGAPVTHEDDPVRAVGAALDILASINEYARELRDRKRVEKFQMRVGLNTGLVVVGNVGSDLHMEYLAVGDTVNLAARMQSTAEPNTILISQGTARWAKHMFDLESRGAIEVKGKAEPVAAFRVLTRKAIPQSARGIEGLDSPMVGREDELAMLQTCIDAVLQGRGQIASVIGDAGLGKSRLVAEARKWVAAERRMQWCEGRALSYQTTTTYAMIAELFNHLFGLLPEESDAEKYESIRAGVERVTGHRAAEFSPFICSLLGLTLEGDASERVRYLEPPQLRDKIFNAVFHFFEHLAGKQPVVLVFEDLHWADSVSLAMLEHLLPLAQQSRILILALFRPQTQEPSWRFHETAQREHLQRYTSIALEPLDERSSRQLVANLLEIEDLPEKVRALILKKAEGNPFFVEEVIRSLLDAKLVVREGSHWRATREIANIQLPDTLAGVIGARLDRLDEESKRVAQTAAVIGREFEFDVLRDVSEAKPGPDAAIATLQRRELVREKSRAPALVYLFKHALTQEAAYASLLLSKRRELHKRVADWLERNESERVNEIAWHYMEAHDTLSALPYLVRAGERAARAYSTPEAVQYLAKAIKILDEVNDPGLARRAYETLGGIYMLTADVPNALLHFNAMIEYGKKSNSMEMQVSAHNKLGQISGMFMGQIEEADKHLQEAERLGRACKDGMGLSELYTIRCGISTLRADFSDATHYLAESVTMGRDLNLGEAMVFGLTHTANTYTYMLRFEDAFEKSKEALAAAEQIGNQKFIADNFSLIRPIYYLHLGDLERARVDAEKGTDIAEKIGYGLDHALGLYFQGYVAHLRGEYENALSFHQAALKVSETQPLRLDALPLAEMAAIQIELGNPTRALELIQQTLPLFQHPMIAASGALARAMLAWSYLALGRVGEAGEQIETGFNYPSFLGLVAKPRLIAGKAFEAIANNHGDDAVNLVTEARKFAEDHAMKYEYPFIAVAEAHIRAACGDIEGALTEYLRGESLALEMGMCAVVLPARIGAAKLLSELGCAQEAKAKNTQARALIDEIAAPMRNEQTRKTFVDSASKRM